MRKFKTAHFATLEVVRENLATSGNNMTFFSHPFLCVCCPYLHKNKYLAQNKLKYLAGVLYHINVIVINKESNEEV